MSFELLLFSTDTAVLGEAVAAGVTGAIVDWEREGKHDRQLGAETHISADTFDDLARVRSATTARVICRVNRAGPHAVDDVERAIEGGADEVLLPMVRGAREVEETLDQVAGRCPVGILIETEDAIEARRELAQLPLSRVYVGLNDLAIDRGSATIFDALLDGTVDRVREAFECDVGFGGLTLPDRGSPLPARLLIAEMARTGCTFGVLRRSFLRDVRGLELAQEVPRLLEALEQAAQRNAGDVAHDRTALEAAVATLATGDARAATG